VVSREFARHCAERASTHYDVRATRQFRRSPKPKSRRYPRPVQPRRTMCASSSDRDDADERPALADARRDAVAGRAHVDGEDPHGNANVVESGPNSVKK
jgi:hypothetical protein